MSSPSTQSNGKPMSSSSARFQSDNGVAHYHSPRAVLSSDVSIKGSVKFRSELVIDGDLEGTIDSIGRLTVGRNAHVRGDIKSRSVTVHGTVDGNLSAGEKCELRAGCILRGDIETSRLVVDDDVTFIGSAEIAMEDYLSELRGHVSRVEN
jgi:cytoskeletal protein CcmA (bactofilin family)